METVIQSSRKEPHGHLHLGSAVLETDRETCISEVTPRRMGGTDFPGGRARCLGSAPGWPPDPGPAVTRGTNYDTSAWCFPVQGTLSHSWWALEATETQAAVRVIHKLAVHAHSGPRGSSPQLVLLPPRRHEAAAAMCPRSTGVSSVAWHRRTHGLAHGAAHRKSGCGVFCFFK